MKRIVRFALWGAIGFCVGGAIGGAITSNLDTFVSLAILGIFGGASLGFVFKGWKGAMFLALAGGAGFVVGTFLSVVIGMALGLTLPRPINEIYGLATPFIMGAITGAIGGMALGLALKDWRGAGLLALAGAVGFGIAAQINQSLLLKLPTTQILSTIIPLSFWGLIGGSSLGASLGYLERRKANRENQAIQLQPSSDIL
ncbi:hypothetical protein ACFLUS_02030 [Chloroflexota bacterium]